MIRSSLLIALLTVSGCATTRPTAIYFAMVDRFENGDPQNDATIDVQDPQSFHGGDLQGLITRLDWIQSLGFDTVWLSPIFTMRTEKWNGYGAFHGYWTYDLASLEPRFGDEATLKRLRNELDRRHMKLILDVVLNHVGPDAPILTQHPGWFHHSGGITDWNDPRQLVERDVHGLPDFATENPEVFEALVAATDHWVQLLHPEGLRLDAVKHVPIEFWARYNTRYPMLRLGELLDGGPEAISKTWSQGKFTSMFDFPLAFATVDVFCRGASPSKLAVVLTNDRRYPDPSQLVTLLDNHDLPRLWTECGGDLDRVKAALTFLFAMRGIPSISWGTEVGLEGAKEPDNRASMRFVEHPLRAFIAAQLTRRAETPALHSARTEIAEVTEQRLVLHRMEASGDAAIPVIVENQRVTLGSRLQIAPSAGTRRITFTGEGSIVGSGPELGDWNRANAISLPVTLELPLHGVFELKRLVNGEWTSGPNQLVFVTEGLTNVSVL